MILFQKYIPLDVIRYIDKFVYQTINDSNFKEAIKLWTKDNKECAMIYGHIS